METDKKDENIQEESPEERQVQLEDKSDNFSDQEEEDDYFKLQITNYNKFKTGKEFHKKSLLIDPNIRQVRSARFSPPKPRNLKKKPEKQPEVNTSDQQPQGRLDLNNSSGKAVNSTTINDNMSSALQNNQQKSEEEKEKEKIDKGDSSIEEDEESEGGGGDEEGKEIEPMPHRKPNEDILQYYERLRNHYAETKIQVDDPDFPCNANIFCDEYENPNGEYEIEFERPDLTEENIEFFAMEPHTNNEYNIEHEFKLRRGLLNDKFFVGAMLMLFRQKEEFFTDLVIDFEHVNENLKAGFCGFQFFMNGEWKVVTVDTKLPCH